jgi:hypothetical protein
LDKTLLASLCFIHALFYPDALLDLHAQDFIQIHHQMFPLR